MARSTIGEDIIAASILYPERITRMGPWKLHRAAQALLRYTYTHVDDRCEANALRQVITAPRVSRRTLMLVWEQVANPEIQDAILTSPQLSDATKTQLALERLAHPSVQVMDWF